MILVFKECTSFVDKTKIQKTIPHYKSSSIYLFICLAFRLNIIFLADEDLWWRFNSYRLMMIYLQFASIAVLLRFRPTCSLLLVLSLPEFGHFQFRFFVRGKLNSTRQ